MAIGPAYADKLNLNIYLINSSHIPHGFEAHRASYQL